MMFHTKSLSSQGPPAQSASKCESLQISVSLLQAKVKFTFKGSLPDGGAVVVHPTQPPTPPPRDARQRRCAVCPVLVRHAKHRTAAVIGRVSLSGFIGSSSEVNATHSFLVRGVVAHILGEEELHRQLCGCSGVTGCLRTERKHVSITGGVSDDSL